MISSNIRVPEDLWNSLKEIADNELRCINAQIVFLIKKCVEENKK